MEFGDCFVYRYCYRWPFFLLLWFIRGRFRGCFGVWFGVDFGGCFFGGDFAVEERRVGCRCEEVLVVEGCCCGFELGFFLILILILILGVCFVFGCWIFVFVSGLVFDCWV